MKQLQNGIYTFNTGEKKWGEEVNQNFEALDNLISGVTGNNDKIELLSEKIQTNADSIVQTKDDLIDNITNTKNGLQDQIDILNNNILALKYKIDNMDISVDSVDNAKHAEEADVAEKLKKSLTIGNVSFNGETDIVIAVDGTPLQNSSNLINSDAVYDALELKQDKATTLSGYKITDAYTKSEINNIIEGVAGINHNHDDKYYSKTEIDTKLVEKSNTDHNHDDKYYSKSEIDIKLVGVAGINHNHDDKYYSKTEINNLLVGKSDTDHTHSNYLTGITKAMVTRALGYTPPTQDTTYSAGTNLSLDGTTFNVSDTPSFTSIILNGFTITID